MKTRTLAFVIASLASAALFAGEYDDLTVPSQAGKNNISGSSVYAGYGPARAFSTGDRCLLNFPASPCYIQYQFTDGSTPIVTNYSFKCETGSSDGFAKRIPTAWRFLGSNSGLAGEWVVLDEQSEIVWTSASEKKRFPFVNSTPYTYYRLEVTAVKDATGKVMGLAELEFYGLNPGADSLQITGEPFECGSVEPDYSILTDLTEASDPIPCSASGETLMYGDDRKVTAKGWKLYELDEGQGAYVLRDESAENILNYVHNGRKNRLVWQFEVQCKVAIGAAEHGSASFDKEFTRSDKYATLTATADTGFGFAYWIGDVSDTDKYDNPLLLRMDVPKSVTPVFLPAKTVTPYGDETPQHAVDSFGADGGVLFMEAGTYGYDAAAPALYLTTPVVVRGAGRDKTVIDGQGCKMRAVTLANANAAVVGVAISNVVGGTSQADSAYGKGLLITAAGGMFIDGAVTDCKGGSGTGAAAALGGRISRSIIRRNSSGSAGGLFMDNASTVVDNCLIADNTSVQEGGAADLVGGTLLNCHIVNNYESSSSSHWAGGGGIYMQAGHDRYIYNCVFSGNRFSGLSGAGAPDWAATDSGRSGVKGAANNAVAVNLPNATGGIADPVVFEPGDDWIPTAAAVTKDAGKVHASQSSRDLLGNPRVSGAAIDVGCYEFDDNVVGCSFAVNPILARDVDPVEFVGKVSGYDDDSGLTFAWSISNKTTGAVIERSGKSVPFEALAEGRYAATLRVYDGSDEVASYPIDDCLRVVPVRIMLADGDDLAAAAARADQGTEIVLGNGTYEIDGKITMDRPMSIVSESGRYSSVTVAVTTSQIALSLSHNEAKVEGVTILGPVAISDVGGTVSKCRITGCYGNRGQGVPVKAEGGRVTHCIIDRNGVKPDGTISRNTNGAMNLNNSAQVDNCLIAGNYSTETAIYLANKPQILNCTVAGNNSTGKGGIEMFSSGTYCIRNCIVANNVGANNNKGQPNFYFAGQSNFEQPAKSNVINCHTGLAESRDTELFTNEIYGETGFVNPSEGDYSLGPQSCCRDKGVALGAALMEGTDLACNPRVSGDGIDIGCYEIDASQVGLTFAAVPAVATTASNVVFTAKVIGGDVADFAFSWTITNTRTGEETTGTGAELTLTEPTEGLYTGIMAVTKDGQPVSTITNEICLTIVPARIDLADGDDLAASCARADEGTEIVLGAGTYPLGKMQTFKSGVTVRSASGRYADAIVTVTNAVVAFKLDHARARVQDVTVKGPVLIEVNGGTLSGCRVTGCYANRGGLNVPVYAKAGSVTHCVIDHNGLNPNGAVSRNTVGGVMITSPASMDNCLIANNYGGDGFNQKGVVTIGNSPKIWNCTIAGNNNDGIGGLYCYSSGDYDIRNCVVAGNTSTSTAAGQPNLYCTQSGSFADSAREHIVNCHFGLETERASVMTKYEVYGVTRFKSPDTGNFRLKQDSCCRDVGVKMSAAFEAGTDLDGCPRVFTGDKHPIIDLGCYEAHPGGLTIFVY